MFVHRKWKLFLSVYIDDFKLAGDATNIARAWAAIGKYLSLDPPTDSVDDVYFGLTQKECQVPPHFLVAKCLLYQQCVPGEKIQSAGDQRAHESELANKSSQDSGAAAAPPVHDPTSWLAPDPHLRPISQVPP